MTLKESWGNLLIELNKKNVESVLLESFNYLLHKSKLQYLRKHYNLDNINIGIDDGLRALRKDIISDLTITDKFGNVGIYKDIYETTLDINYYHIESCIVEYEFTSDYNKCNTEPKLKHYTARRSTPNIWGNINKNFYFKPKYNNPYYHISQSIDDSGLTSIFGLEDNEIKSISEFTNALELENKQQLDPNNVRIEIRSGILPKGVKPTKVYIEYLKQPKLQILTQEELDSVHDSTEKLEFSDDVCNEIIKELVILFLENASDPRLQTNPVINQTDSLPTQK